VARQPASAKHAGQQEGIADAAKHVGRIAPQRAPALSDVEGPDANASIARV
jgi:hypothetical protein